MGKELYSFIINDNSELVKKAIESEIIKALERCGMQAEGYAKDLVPVDTGNLRNSISHRVDEKEKVVYIGTNNEYAPYVELGTGKYAEGGRKDPWVYQDTEGNWHHTHGQKAQPYLVPAVKDHKQTYRNIIKDQLSGKSSDGGSYASELARAFQKGQKLGNKFDKKVTKKLKK